MIYVIPLFDVSFLGTICPINKAMFCCEVHRVHRFRGELHEVVVQVADPPRDGDELRQEPSGLLATGTVGPHGTTWDHCDLKLVDAYRLGHPSTLLGL